MIEFYISEKFITVDESTIPDADDIAKLGPGLVGDNAGYIAHFNFDSEWDGLEKTARFLNGGIKEERVLKNDIAEFPKEVLKSGFVEVGVFTGDIASTSTKVPIYASILQKYGLPADPTPDVYSQLMDAWSKMVNTITIRTWTDEDFENLDGGEK